MEPGFYTYKVKGSGEMAIALVVDKPFGMSNCVCFFKSGASVHYSTEEMGGEWGEKIEFQEKRKPAEVFHPGVYLIEELNARGWSWNSEFIRRSKANPRKVGEIINGFRGIKPKMAKKFAKAFGTSPEYWMNLQKAWDERNK